MQGPLTRYGKDTGVEIYGDALVEDVRPGDFIDTSLLDESAEAHGRALLERGAVAVVTLAGGSGSRWTQGAGTVKALHPFAKLAGSFRTFLEVHLAKSRQTARRFGVADSYNAAQNIQGGVQYLAWLLKRYGGDLKLAAAGYNAGEGAVDKYKGVPPYSETRRYVERVSTLAERYRGSLAQR